MIAVRGVVCATDIERPARAALRYAFFVAERFDAALDVVHVGAPSEGPSSYVDRERRIEQLMGEQRLHARLDAVVRSVPAENIGRASTHILDGTLVSAVGTYAERRHADLIVLGSSFEPGAAPGAASDTVAARLGRTAACPVLTVPPRAPSPVLEIRRVLLPVAAASSAGVAWAALFARRFDAVVELLCAPVGPRARTDALDARARDVADALHLARVTVEQTLVEPSGELCESTLERIAKGGCDLVVLAAVGADGGQRAGDAVAEIRRRSSLPVLSLPPVAPGRPFVDRGLASEQWGEASRDAGF